MSKLWATFLLVGLTRLKTLVYKINAANLLWHIKHNGELSSDVVAYHWHTAHALILRQDLTIAEVSCVIQNQSDWSIMMS